MEIEAAWADVVENLDETAGLARFAGPGGWNDADMLEVLLASPNMPGPSLSCMTGACS